VQVSRLNREIGALEGEIERVRGEAEEAESRAAATVQVSNSTIVPKNLETVTTVYFLIVLLAVFLRSPPSRVRLSPICP
jgi:hypothetical protein